MSTTRDDDDFVPRKIVDPTDIGFNFAQVMQWVALHPDIPHTAFRVYCVLRALYTHKRDLRSISKDQLRFMIPGVNGKPMSTTVLNDALKVLAEFELVTNPDGKRQTWQLREPGTNRFVARTEWTFQLGQLPPEGDGFAGWRNVFDKHDAYPGPGWDKKPLVTPVAGIPATDLPLAAGDTLNQGSAGQSRNRNSGRTDRNSETRDRNSGRRNRNSGRAEAVTSANLASNNSIQEQLQEQTSVRPSRARVPSGVAVGSPTDGRTDIGSKEDRKDETHVATALELVPDQTLAKVRGRATQVQKLRERVAAVLAAGHDQGAVATYLRDTLATARTATYVIRAFDDDRLQDITPPASYTDDKLAAVHDIWPVSGGSATGGIAACSSCLDANPAARSNARFRVLHDNAGDPVRDPETGRLAPCPTCHPDCVRTAQ
ncbi:hypothetical protein [Amycolatopsis sp. NBC_01286]|uniref:hypothetical protein n=1 Tax=Amycolatopsis sp. NBC_01286 TaxID=2903560 RepID=UPI002E1117E5|nr:hypothetical protein OG570_48210 [Amycolatopsis sp. NBC_01286]